MIDVGKHEGVSAQMVSRFFDGGYVSTNTLMHIKIAVREHGQRQNRLPMQMKSNHTDMIGRLAMGHLMPTSA